jgi:hypothetical protein
MNRLICMDDEHEYVDTQLEEQNEIAEQIFGWWLDAMVSRGTRLGAKLGCVGGIRDGD